MFHIFLQKFRISIFSAWRLLFFVALGFCLTGCQSGPRGEPVPPAIDPVAEQTQSADPVSVSSPSPAGITGEARHLVIWAPEFFTRSGDGSAGQTIDAALTQFEQNRANLSVEIQTRAATGESGTFAYLQSAQQVAPDILPDIALVRTSDLWQLADLGVFPPFTAQESAAFGEFYPFAEAAITYSGEPWGVPYTADVVHLVYHPERVQSPPVTWANLLEANYRYLFPAGSRDGYAGESILLQYVGAGGELLEDGTVTNPEALEAVFDFYGEAKGAGIFPEEVEQYAGFSSVWDDFRQRPVDLADVTASSLLLGNAAVTEIGYQFAPTLSGVQVTPAETWAFAVLTKEPEQRAVAMDLLAVLLQPAVQGEWSQLAGRLPTRPAAFAVWPENNGYYNFLRDEAVPIAFSQPNGRLYLQFSARVQEALRGVLAGTLTPAEAVLQVRGSP
ncbi:MAG: extracellular solute-binding protein [Caldilineaceae bacterium]|nr:extracellular solute-binding protein [Caldilineaceae bacterium]